MSLHGHWVQPCSQLLQQLPYRSSPTIQQQVSQLTGSDSERKGTVSASPNSANYVLLLHCLLLDELIVKAQSMHALLSTLSERGSGSLSDHLSQVCASIEF